MLDWLFQQSEPKRAFDSNWFNQLNVDEKEIRLLRVFPAFRHSAPIVCDIRSCTLDLASSHAYRALSYAWGHPEAEKREITLEGSTLMVQPNLDSALRHLRSKVFPLIIWVDAVCINQSDLKERGQQVMLMREVYLNATIVNVWLGPASDESDRAMDFVAAAWTELERNGGQNSGRILSMVHWSNVSYKFYFTLESFVSSNEARLVGESVGHSRSFKPRRPWEIGVYILWISMDALQPFCANFCGSVPMLLPKH